MVEAEAGADGLSAHRSPSAREVFVRLVVALVGVAVLSMGSAILRASGLGIDPYTAANVAISDHLGIDLGTCQLIFNAVLFLIVLAAGRRHLGLGTVINAVLVGYLVQWFSALLAGGDLATRGPAAHMVLFAVGILLFAFGAATYIGAGLGASPYDAVAPVIVDRIHWRYRPVRTAQDVAFLILAVALGGPVGPGTVVTAFFCGPLIEFFTSRVVEPALSRMAKGGGIADAAETAHA